MVLLALVLTAACTAPPSPPPQTPVTSPTATSANPAAWVRTAPSPAGFRDYPLMVLVDGTFLVIGGFPEGSKTLATTGYRYDPESDAWFEIAAAPAGLSWPGPVVVREDVVYVVDDRSWPTDSTEAPNRQDCDPDEALYSYDLSADAWAEVPLPAGPCSLDPAGLVATDDALVALSTGRRPSLGEGPLQWPHAITAVYDPEAKSWSPRKLPAEVADGTFRWATWASGQLLVVVEQLPPEDAFTNTSPGTPAVYTWDYEDDSWQRLDQPGSDTLDWADATSRIQTPNGPAYSQEGNFLAFHTGSGTFQLSRPNCGEHPCRQLNLGLADLTLESSFGNKSMSDASVFSDGWMPSLPWYFPGDKPNVASVSLYLVKPSTGEFISLPPRDASDPRSELLPSSHTTGGSGQILSCLTNSYVPHGLYLEDLGSNPVAPTVTDDHGTGAPGAVLRLTLPGLYPTQETSMEYVVVTADGTWRYRRGSESGSEMGCPTTVLGAEYVHKPEPYCYFLRY